MFRPFHVSAFSNSAFSYTTRFKTFKVPQTSELQTEIPIKHRQRNPHKRHQKNRNRIIQSPRFGCPPYSPLESTIFFLIIIIIFLFFPITMYYIYIYFWVIFISRPIVRITMYFILTFRSNFWLLFSDILYLIILL